MMISVEMDGKRYAVVFRHDRPTAEMKQQAAAAGVEIVLEGITRCTVGELRMVEGKQEFIPVVQGRARCVAGDPFVKEVGRKIALTRALKGMWAGAEGREKRGKVWEAYWGRK